MIHLNYPDYTEAISKEWLVTNGLGGFSSSTVCGANTRRYHGLLIAALDPPTERYALVSKVEEILAGPNQAAFSLSTNQYPGTIYPQGFQYLKKFERFPLPQATFEVEGNVLNKTVFMVHGANTSVVEYHNGGEHPFSLELTPLLVFRDYHGLMRESSFFDYYLEQLELGAIKIHAHYGAPALYWRYSKGDFDQKMDWYRQFQYDKEAYRGLDHEEDCRSIGRLTLELLPGETAYLVFSTQQEALNGDPGSWKQAEINRTNAIPPSGVPNSFARDLAIAGDQFLVNRLSSANHTLIAGYHWFTDWGRDTMIAMRGLVIATGKKETARSIVRTFLQHLDQGMIPNRFPDKGITPEFNTIDATLWLFVVLYEYYEQFGDLDFVQELLPHLQEIIEAHIKGTRYHIHVTEEGLLFGGEGLAQLTWMDAKVGDFVVTPRQGCPVEINALWYNALRIFQFFQDKLGLAESPYEDLAGKTLLSFRQYFWNEKGYLNDVVIPGNYTDESIRPNQIYALCLPFPLLNGDKAEKVLHTVESHLYTDFGLRSLSPEHRDFKPLYGGDSYQRDTAYHQGTVWAFLWGEYALAFLKLRGFSQDACTVLWEKLGALRRHFYEEGCVHGIAEIFDGAIPGPGRGCIHQAWSVGMLLRVLLDPEWKEPVES